MCNINGHYHKFFAVLHNANKYILQYCLIYSNFFNGTESQVEWSINFVLEIRLHHQHSFISLHLLLFLRICLLNIYHLLFLGLYH